MCNRHEARVLHVNGVDFVRRRCSCSASMDWESRYPALWYLTNTEKQRDGRMVTQGDARRRKERLKKRGSRRSGKDGTWGKRRETSERMKSKENMDERKAHACYWATVKREFLDCISKGVIRGALTFLMVILIFFFSSHLSAISLTSYLPVTGTLDGRRKRRRRRKAPLPYSYLFAKYGTGVCTLYNSCYYYT